MMREALKRHVYLDFGNTYLDGLGKLLILLIEY